MHRFENALAVVNPAARNGDGARKAEFLRSAAASGESPFRALSVATTQAPGHAEALAASAAGHDVLLVAGGDGVIHEAVAGLLRIPRAERPALAVLPCGNGNDFARTLGMPVDERRAIETLSTARRGAIDVGLANGEPFVQTLSFGLDAAIAVGTHERRRRTGRTGTLLFLEEGIEQLVFHRDAYAYSLAEDGAAPRDGAMLLFAVQLGPTYGGGFRICPDADPADGLFDYCIAHPPLGLLRATSIFLKAKNGAHTGHTDVLSFGRAETLSIRFDAAPPVQIDGEAASGRTFDVSILPRELDVLFPTEGPLA